MHYELSVNSQLVCIVSLGEDPNALNARKNPFSNPECPFKF